MNTRYASRLVALCGTDSPSGERVLLDRTCRLLAGYCTEAGLEVELVDEPPGLHLIARTQGAGRGRVLLLGHHDTVFAAGTGAARPVTFRAGRGYGPGVADMKGGLLVALAALERLALEPDGAHGLVELHSVPDEEARTRAPFVLERWRGAQAALCFECGRPSGAIVTRRKAGTWLALRAQGGAAHAGDEAGQGRSALMALIAEARRIALNVHQARPGLAAHVTTLCTQGSKNTIPGQAEMTVDLRAATAEQLEDGLRLVAAVSAYDGVTISVSEDRGFPPLTRAPALAARALSMLAREGQVAIEATAGGASDASWASRIGIPTVDGLGPVGGRDHTVDEYIDLASIEPRVRATAGLCRELGGGGTPASAPAGG